jgi:hypothetical protein
MDEWLQGRAIEETCRVRKTATKQAAAFRILDKTKKVVAC